MVLVWTELAQHQLESHAGCTESRVLECAFSELYVAATSAAPSSQGVIKRFDQCRPVGHISGPRLPCPMGLPLPSGLQRYMLDPHSMHLDWEKGLMSTVVRRIHEPEERKNA